MYGRRPGGVSRAETLRGAGHVHASRWESRCWPSRRRRATAVAPTDDDLIALALAGRGDAFGELVAALRARGLPSRVAHAARRRGRQGRDPGGLGQGLPGAGLVPAGRAFSTWIFTICYRVCCDRLAKRKRFSGDEPPDIADPAAGPERVYEAADEAARLRARHRRAAREVPRRDHALPPRGQSLRRNRRRSWDCRWER